MAAKKSGARKSARKKYGRKAGKSVESAMRRRKRGTLKRGKGGRGGTVKSREQAIAIGLSEAREKGAKVPRKKSSTRKKSSAKKSSTRKKSTARKSSTRKKTATRKKTSTGKKTTRRRS